MKLPVFKTLVKDVQKLCELRGLCVWYTITHNRSPIPVLPTRRIEGLMSYAEAHEEWEQLDELKAQLKAVIDRLP